MRIFQSRLISLIFFAATLLSGCRFLEEPSQDAVTPGVFDAERAFQDVVTQVGFGPRFPGSPGHAQVREWLVDLLTQSGWQPRELEGDFFGQQVFNIEACRGSSQDAREGYVLIGAHYDTRMYADKDPDLSQRDQPVPGANDGASGVAVLTELARVLPQNIPTRLCLVFFDAEDNGRIGEWEWAAGARFYAAQMSEIPDAVIIVDMVGDFNQYFPVEQNSTPGLVEEIWEVAAGLGIESFSQEQGKRILDDHVPFLELGIPAVDIIDLDYPYWHTTADTPDKVSPQSLENVGDVLLEWLLSTD